MEVIDSRFLLEHFLSDNQETKSKTSKRLRSIVEKRTGILPTIVVTEIVRYVFDKRGREEATIRYLSLKRSDLTIADLTKMRKLPAFRREMNSPQTENCS